MKIFDSSKTLPEIALSITGIDNFINAIKRTKGEINDTALVTKHQNKTCKRFKYKGRIKAKKAKRVYTCYF